MAGNVTDQDKKGPHAGGSHRALLLRRKVASRRASTLHENVLPPQRLHDSLNP